MDPLNGQTPAPSSLHLDVSLWQLMRQDVINRAPREEACGLLTGRFGKDFYQALEVHPITNQLHSPTHYDMAPKELLDIFTKIEQQGDELVAIYHSHINGPENPSETDITQAYYPECIYLIWSPLNKDWACRGYLIREGQVSQTDLVLHDERNQ